MDLVSLPTLLARSTGLNHLAFRPDGLRLAVADTALNVSVQEGARTLWTRALTPDEPKVASVACVRGLAYAPDGKALYALAPDGLLALDAATGETFWSYEPPRALGFLVTSPTALAVRSDGIVAAAFDNGAIGAWSRDGDLCGIWKDADVQRRLAFTPDGKLLGDDSFGLSLFDVDTRKRLLRTPLRDRSYGLAVAPDGGVAIRTLREAWQLAPSGEILARTPVEASLPLLAYHPHEPLLALGATHEVAFANGDGAVVRRCPLEATLLALAFAPDGRLVVGGADGSLTTV